MGRTKDKDKEKDKKKKKDKGKDKTRKEREHAKEKSRKHKSERKHGIEDSGDETSRHHSPSSRGSKRDKEEIELKRKRSPSPSEPREKDEPQSKGKRTRYDPSSEKEQEEEEVRVKSSGDVISLSIEETNKLRVQLGLKPLEIDNEPKKSETDVSKDDIPKMKTEEFHAPPKNIGDEKAAEKLREKLKTMREARELAKKLSSVKGLGEEDGKEDTINWVTRIREKQKEKEMAEKRAKLLAEMDEEFGIGDIVNEAFQQQRHHQYNPQDLSGLKIEHKEDHFKEGRDVVLTLKDAGVLDEEEGDILINVNMVDEEKATRNVQLKKGVPVYQQYEEEFDEYGNPKTRSLLCKYDEEIEGIKKESFLLGQDGTYDLARLEKEKEESKRLLQQKAIGLDLPPAVIASEYYTSDEMTQFKKRKKKKRKERFKIDDILPLGNDDETKDHGSRQKEDTETGNQSMELGNEDMEVDSKSDPSLLDEHDTNMETALKRTRRLLKRGSSTETQTGAAHIVSMLSKVKQEKMDNEDTSEAIVLDTTSEFCRNIGEEEEEEEEDKTKKWQLFGEDRTEEDMEVTDEDSKRGGWAEVDPSMNIDKEKKPNKDADVLELDTVLSTGVAAALQMAVKKGFVEKDIDGKNKKRDGSSKTIIEGVGIRDWEYERDRGRERDRDKDLHGREMSFVEKRNYTPDINIEYVDTMGRLLSQKEAFRQLSHKFHGKSSGKKKTEKRLKRLQEEFFLNQSSTVDTPLQTLEMFRKRQENSQAAYVVLSGGQHNMNVTDIAKRK